MSKDLIQKDKAIKKAMQKMPAPKLASNFTFMTMQRVRQAERLRERSTERRMLIFTIGLSLILFAGGIGTLIYLYPDCIQTSVQYIQESRNTFLQQAKGFPYYLPCIILLLLILDSIGRQLYFKKKGMH